MHLRLFISALLLSLLPLVAQAQRAEAFDNALVEQPAMYPGGAAALVAYINKNTKYPAVAMEEGVQGKVVLRFKVDEQGNVSDIKVKKTLSRECDAEAIRVAQTLKPFIPAKHQGRPVAVWFTLPVSFQFR